MQKLETSPLLKSPPKTAVLPESESCDSTPRVPPIIDKDSQEAATRALVWRLDVFILLPLAFLYLICYLDRSSLANAKSDIKASLSLTTEQYGLASSFFQIGYIACEVPANLILKRSRPSLWLGALVVSFGVVAAVTAVSKTFSDLTIIRVFLGIAEAVCQWRSSTVLKGGLVQFNHQFQEILLRIPVCTCRAFRPAACITCLCGIPRRRWGSETHSS